MLTFTAEIDGIENFNRAFNRLESIDDFRPIWPNVIQTFYEIEAEQFDSEGAAGGERWHPLSTVYAESKEQEYPGQPILQREGDLMKSLTDVEAFGAILRPSENELVIGTSVPYALAHHRGSPKRNLPRRPVISMSEQQKRRIQKAIQQGLVRFLREAGIQTEQKAA